MANINPKSNIVTKILLIIFILGAVYVCQAVFFPHQIPGKQYQVVVTRNQSMHALATQLEESKVINNQQVFLAVLRVLGRDRSVKAGLYILKNSMSTWDIVSRLTSGKPDQISVTILEGWRFAQLKDYIDHLDGIKHLASNLSEEQIQNILKIKENGLEGMFFPETYFAAPNQTDLEIYQQAYKLMQVKLNTLFQNKSKVSVLTTPYQIVVLASLIQKETDNPTDMQLVATVFNNRLKAGMKLQDDPAVFYGLHNKAKIRHKDFAIDTDYNTYLHSGLPPGPICIPSLAALNAASQPLDNPKLKYFIAVGRGKTKFSSSYYQHQSLEREYLGKDQ